MSDIRDVWTYNDDDDDDDADDKMETVQDANIFRPKVPSLRIRYNKLYNKLAYTCDCITIIDYPCCLAFLLFHDYGVACYKHGWSELWVDNNTLYTAMADRWSK